MAMIENEVEKKVYKVEDVQNLLGLGRSKAYEFIDKWLNGDEERERVRAE